MTLVSGGPCGYAPGEGAHRDYEGKWTDDSSAIDFGVCGDGDYGLSVRAAHSGFVRVAENDPDYGWTVVIERSDRKLATRYAHLKRRLLVRLGERVVAGEPIGEIGNSGLGRFKRAAHLHFAAYGSRKRHGAVDIASVAGQKPCDNCAIEAESENASDNVPPPSQPPAAPPPPPPTAPSGLPSPVEHYQCLDEQSPLSQSLDANQWHPQQFMTKGSVINQVLVYLRSNDSLRRLVNVGIYTQPSISAAYRLREQAVFAPFDRTEVSVDFNPPITTAPGVDHYLIVTSVERPVSIFRRHGLMGVEPDCLIAVIKGLK